MENISNTNKDNNTLLSMVVIRANTPKEFNIKKHQVTKFKRKNYKEFYTIDDDGYYTYKDVSAEASIHYTENALLEMNDITVIDYNIK
jgi:hypothetical protein